MGFVSGQEKGAIGSAVLKPGHAVLLYLDAVKRHGVCEMPNKGSGVHVEKLEAAGSFRAEPAAE